MDWVSAGNGAPSLEVKLICCSSSWNISFYHGYLPWFTSLSFHIFLSFARFQEDHLFSISLTHIQLLGLLLAPWLFSFKVHTSFLLNSLQVCLMHPLLFCWDTAFPHSSDKPCISSALQDETVVGQRCQISSYEHLEDVNVISANQILVTAFGRSLGFGREMSSGEMEQKQNEGVPVRRW